MSKVIKSILLQKPTYDRLKNHGKMGDSFNDVVERVLDEIEGRTKAVPRI
jgi:predicted CopG family antitoxin